MSIIKNIREQRGFTQAELAKQTGLSLRTIQRLESSNKEPKGHSLSVLSEVFNIKPSALQNQFKSIKQTKESEATSIRLINLSVLSFLGIPFGNIILPLILWRRNRKSKFVDEMGKRIVNFQIIFSVVLSLLLCISPFISRALFSNTSIILCVLFAAYAVNVIIVCRIAMKLQRNNFDFLNSPLRFI
ncbi:helix-turn-helix domain-containing protein [Winogradskyella sp.]|uniref:helix-turn-helix domain-containing protein n=1 Tax=Winogradskyella sp. TaxID=1883156 RepID=UPI0025F06B4C|nr:helix-turn-helix domain-containing protein [Winogradskyella sp.]